MMHPLSDTYASAVGLPNAGQDGVNPNAGQAGNSSADGLVYSGSKGNFFSNFWDAMTHPFSMMSGIMKAATSSVKDDYDTGEWSSQDWINFGRSGQVPYTSQENPYTGSEVIGSHQGDASQDPSGYDQSMWEFEKQKELLAEQRAFNSAEAEKNREWQERMSNTAYQRATQDLEAAGLNKWLAVTGGGNGASASTPSGATASSQAGDVTAPNPQLAKALLSFGQGIVGTIFKLIG